MASQPLKIAKVVVFSNNLVHVFKFSPPQDVWSSESINWQSCCLFDLSSFHPLYEWPCVSINWESSCLFVCGELPKLLGTYLPHIRPHKISLKYRKYQQWRFRKCFNLINQKKHFITLGKNLNYKVFIYLVIFCVVYLIIIISFCLVILFFGRFFSDKYCSSQTWRSTFV